MNDGVARLVEIQAEMLELLESADFIITQLANEHVHNRANAYWIPQIKMALTNEHEYLGGSMCSMQDTIDEMSPSDEDACPGCGCEPGDGKTGGCVHPDGCGWPG